MRVAADGLPVSRHAEAQGLIDAYMEESVDWFEFAVLAGEAVTQGLSPRTAEGIHAAALSRGKEFEVAEQRREVQLRDHADADWAELQRVTRGVTVLEFFDDWTSVVSRSGLAVADTLAKVADHDVSIASQVPGLDVISALRARRFRDGGRPWTRTDFFDVVSMQHAIPYCDLVSTDRHWAHLANRTHLPERYATTITGRPSELLATLERLG